MKSEPIARTTLVSLALATSVWAASPVPITNAGFEAQNTADGNFVTSATGWSRVNSASEIGVWNPVPGNFTAEAPEGFNVGYVYGGILDAGLSQVLSSSLMADATYNLSVKVGNSITYAYDGYRVQLLAGGTVIAEDNSTLSPAVDSFAPVTVNYVYNVADAALVGQPLEIRLLGKNQSASTTGQTEFDDVQLTLALANPIAAPGGPYTVSLNGSLAVDGSTSRPSDGQAITTYEWDLDNDGDFDEAVTGATPAAIPYATLIATSPGGFGMEIGANTIKLRVTDNSSPTPKTSIVEGIVNLGGPMVIYEPFADPQVTLNGNTAGMGLTGNWSAQAAWAVDSGSLPWGALQTSGNRVRATTGGSTGATVSVPTGTLAGSGLLNDNATLWFSMVYTTTPGAGGGNPDAGFALGTASLGGANNIPMNSAGNGIGFSVKTGQLYATTWAGGVLGRPAASATASEPVSGGTSYLVVGEIIWGADATTPDTINLYFPDKALAQGAVVATRSAVLTQSAFNVITYNHKNDSTPAYVDEIRFGVSYADVVPANTSPLTLASADIVDNKSGGPVLESETLVYTVNFNKPVEPTTVTADDFENGGTSPITINSVTVSGSQAIVTVTPTFPGAAGTLKLQVKSGAVIEDFLGNDLNTSSPIADDTVITVNADTVPPTVLSIVSPPAASPIYGLPVIPYTVTFDKYFMNDATVTAADFTNAGTATISVGTVTRISTGTAPATYTFEVTPTSTGTLQLQLSGAVSDAMGNNAATPVGDDTIYTFAGSESPKSTITVVNSAQGQDIGGGAGVKTLATAFNASGASKLVLVIGGEHGFGGNTGGRFTAASYNGTPMTLVVQEEAGIPTAAIFYLDNPSSISPGNVQVTQDNHNGSIFRIYALAGTAPGVGVSNKSTTNGVGMITATSNSLVIAGVLNAGPNGGNGATNMSAVAPLVENPLSDLESGSRWVSMCFGTGTIASPSYGTFSFSGANSTDLLATVAVEIPAATAGSTSYSSWTAGPFSGTLTNTSSSLDFDGGGLATGLEWVLGGDPTLGSDDAGIAPDFDNISDPAFFIFTYNRSDAAFADPNTTIAVQYSTNLSTWTNAVAGTDVIITPTDNGAFDSIQVKLRRTLAGPGGRLFARLNVVVAP